MTLNKYAALLTRLLDTSAAHSAATSLTSGILFVEQGDVFAKTVLGGRAPTSKIGEGRVIDRLGHERPLYRPLLAYCLTRAGHRQAVRPETWEGPASAAVGDRVAAAAWAGLARLAADGAIDEVFQRLSEGQQSSGAFLAAGRGDNLDTLWFHELAILHAVASFSIQAKQPALWPAVARAVRYHVEETQPDHATNQPWGLPAFLVEPAGWPLADSMLHAASAHAAIEGGASPGLTLMLLADALYCLHQLGIRHD